MLLCWKKIKNHPFPFFSVRMKISFVHWTIWYHSMQVSKPHQLTSMRNSIYSDAEKCKRVVLKFSSTMVWPNSYCRRDMLYSELIAIDWYHSHPPEPIIDDSIDVIVHNRCNNRSHEHVIHCIPMGISPMVNYRDLYHIVQ